MRNIKILRIGISYDDFYTLSWTKCSSTPLKYPSNFIISEIDRIVTETLTTINKTHLIKIKLGIIIILALIYIS